MSQNRGWQDRNMGNRGGGGPDQDIGIRGLEGLSANRRVRSINSRLQRCRIAFVDAERKRQAGFQTRIDALRLTDWQQTMKGIVEELEGVERSIIAHLAEFETSVTSPKESRPLREEPAAMLPPVIKQREETNVREVEASAEADPLND